MGVLAERVTKGQEYMSIKVGNLLPGQQMTICAQLIQPLIIKFATYSFSLPVAFYPDYSKLGSDAPFPYQFSYSVVMKSSQKISLISKPAHSICEQDVSGRYATIFCTKPELEIQVFFRTDEMRQPQLVYAKSPKYPGEVAYSVSFVPTFEPEAPLE